MGGNNIFNKYRVSDSLNSQMASYNLFSRGKFGVICLIIQLVMVLLYGLFVTYDRSAQPKNRYQFRNMEIAQSHFGGTNRSALNRTKKVDNIDFGMIDRVDSMFQDSHMFIVGGFGIIFMYLKRYCYSGVGLTMLITSLVFQWSTLCQGFFNTDGDGMIEANVLKMLGADGMGATILISWGAVLGKIDPLQALIMTFLEVPLAATNEWVATKVYQSRDAGGSVLCHVFSTYFGLGVVLTLFRRENDDENDKQGSSYTSDIIAIIGSIILWVYWPSLLGAGLTDDMRHRAVINTYYAMAASCVTTFAISSLLDKDNKFSMAHVQNASLAGGVAIGAVVDLVISPYGALLMGIGGALITVIGMVYTTPFLRQRLHLNDVAGVNNLHGLTGIFGGLVGAIMACRATTDDYGFSLYEIYPAMAPKADSGKLLLIQQQAPIIHSGDDRTALSQAAYQMMALVTTFFLSLLGGLLTGMILRLPIFDQPEYDQLFDDGDYWRLPEEEPVDESVDENFYVNDKADTNNLKEFVQMSESSTKNKIDEESMEGWIRNRSKSVPTMLFPHDEEVDLVTLVASKGGRKRSRAGFTNRAYKQSEA